MRFGITAQTGGGDYGYVAKRKPKPNRRQSYFFCRRYSFVASASAPQFALYDFLRMTAKEGGALYLLGDIFDRWLGDDIGGKFGTEVQSKLRQLADDGVQVYVQHGNRDFLLGKQFAAAAGCKLIDDNHIISGGILLTHGDKTQRYAVGYQCRRRADGECAAIPQRIEITHAPAEFGNAR